MLFQYTVLYIRIYVKQFTARSLLKKYYPILLDQFPDDHITTIGIMSEQVPIDDRFFNEILTTVNPKEANERILNAIIMMLKHDDQIMGMCKLAKLVMRSARFSKEMLDFELSMYIHHILLSDGLYFLGVQQYITIFSASIQYNPTDHEYHYIAYCNCDCKFIAHFKLLNIVFIKLEYTYSVFTKFLWHLQLMMLTIS